MGSSPERKMKESDIAQAKSKIESEMLGRWRKRSRKVHDTYRAHTFDNRISPPRSSSYRLCRVHMILFQNSEAEDSAAKSVPRDKMNRCHVRRWNAISNNHHK